MKKCQRVTPPLRRELRETPVRLCHDISHLFRARMRQEGEMDGVLSQPGARAILSMIAVSDGLCQRELVEKTHLRPPTVSVILQKMEEEGMVERRSDDGDRRIIRVYLTDYGRAMDAQTIARIQKLDALALAGLSDDEIATAMGLLARMRDNLIASNDKEEQA